MWDQMVRTASALGLTYLLFRRLRAGYEFRRGSWRRRDWIRFGIILSVPACITLVALAMGVAVERGIYDVIPPEYHATYLRTLMALALVGSGGLGGVLGWFVWGEVREDVRRDGQHLSDGTA
jgi:hypothetical protein